MFYQLAYVIVYSVVDYEVVLPSRVEVQEGKSVRLVCGSVKPVVWGSINQSIGEQSHENNILFLQNLRKEHSGRYLCRGVNLEREIFHTFALVIVEPIVKKIPLKYF